MKSPKHPLRHLITSLAAIACLLSVAPPVLAADTTDATAPLPETVPFQLGDAQFSPGDSITILKVTGTKDQITPGETYCVEGTYTLSSHDDADLALFMTTMQDANPTSIDPHQIVRVKKGTGTFRLTRTIDTEGYLHISYYPSNGGEDFGGIHFGQGKWVLHNHNYSQLDSHGSSNRQKNQPVPGKDLVSLSAPNLAMLEYLGSPVTPPADLAASYTPQGLKQSVQTAAQQAGVDTAKIEIDDSEFPPLVGVLCNHADYDKIMAQIKTMSPYEDQGSVGGSKCHAMNIIPWRAYPKEAGDQIQRRLMLRSEMFYDKLSRQE